MPTRTNNLAKVKTGKHRNTFPIFESIGSAAASIGVGDALLKTAKRKGCNAFISGGRVDSAILIPFLFSMLSQASDIPEGFSSWKEVLESEKAKRESIKRQQDEKSVMPTADAERQAAEAMGLTFGELERIANEIPPAVAGQDAVTIFKRLKSEVERMRKTLTQKFQEIGK
jgi:hypothetical protein